MKGSFLFYTGKMIKKKCKYRTLGKTADWSWPCAFDCEVCNCRRVL